MPIERLELRDFRNYAYLEVRPGHEVTVFTGPNAAGKTNAIEAIQLLTAARSFRRPKWEDLVRRGATSARILMEGEQDSGPLEIALEIDDAGGRRFTVNGRTRRRVADVTGRMPSVTFTPDDLELAKGPSERRRAALDDLGEQLSAAYAAVRRDYLKVVRHRNVLLREQRTDSAELGPWDEQLVTLGAKLTGHRVSLFKRVAACAEPLYGELAAGETLAMSYEDKIGIGAAAWTADVAGERIDAAFRETLTRRAAEERARQTTLVGPHRDDVRFEVEGNDARTFASQGQIRTIALAWKLAEVRVVEDVARRAPVLLLDDVMSELDESRRAALTDVVRRDVQTFITTTNLGYFEPALLESATVVELKR